MARILLALDIPDGHRLIEEYGLDDIAEGLRDYASGSLIHDELTYSIVQEPHDGCVPKAQVAAMVRLLGDEEMTPTARMQFAKVTDEPYP